MINTGQWQGQFVAFARQMRSSRRQAEIDLAAAINTCLREPQHVNGTPANFPPAQISGLIDCSPQELAGRSVERMAHLLSGRIDTAVAARSVSTARSQLYQSLLSAFRCTNNAEQHGRLIGSGLAGYVRACISEPRRVGDHYVSAPWQ